ncbi:hypothetical protein [Cupriavidus basilensis]|nr:hypothetical protein [Cupriavidus basilensis]
MMCANVRRSGRCGRARILRALLAALAFAAGAAGMPGSALAANSASTCERMPVKPARAAWIGEDTLVDGMPMSVLAVYFKQSVPEVVSAYRAYWDEQALPVRGARNKLGWLLTATDGDCSYVLQLPDGTGADGMARGVFSAMRLRKADLPPVVGSRFMPLPQGGRVVSDVVSRDPLTVARTVVMELGGSPRRARENFLAELQAAGWRSLSDAAALKLPGRPATGAFAAALQKEGYQLDVTFVPSGAATQAVINLARPL